MSTHNIGFLWRNKKNINTFHCKTHLSWSNYSYNRPASLADAKLIFSFLFHVCIMLYLGLFKEERNLIKALDKKTKHLVK